ncbi:formylglycine-generating enzyme family protein [Erythrobacter sp. CCH5-A1]|jgi:formylglycine-generating enzyme required for sulfatase activity|uniref:formylglycine-generating enzyme family protein n=1 Tax=Erythrobacter sp. CCH5-A1 TaxID=1768792 RepID=UPI00082DD0FB|nr:formylglycine-generating enzyme family protein [Erythrobacter sp. CCH5-A1]
MARWLALLFACALLAACGAAEAPDAPGSSTCKGLADDAMVWIPGGSFTMGEDPNYPEEGPPRAVKVEGFWMDAHEVTNAQFAAFVAATGYVTLAERTPPALPGAPPEMMRPGSAVFRVPTPENRAWWRWAVGAQWRRPTGEGSAITGQERHPVVQIAYEDAAAYAKWAGKQLPDEAQWEYAARAGARALPEPVDGEGDPQANYYQGVFPAKDLGEDGFTGRAPVGCFAANAFGLHDMIGNVWEWTSTAGERADAAEPVGVIKGGSFLCAANYCARYRPAARQFQERGLGTDHIGFRLIDTRRPPPSSED